MAPTTIGGGTVAPRPTADPRVGGKGGEAQRPRPMEYDESAVASQRVSFVGPATFVNVLLGDGVVKVTGGYGGWQRVARPRRKAIVEFQGSDPVQMSIPIMFDEFIAGGEVESKMEALESLAIKSIDSDQPPFVSVYGPGIPHTDLTWVIENIEWGDKVEFVNGVRARQDATVTVVESVTDEHLLAVTYTPGAPSAIPAINCATAKSRVKSYRVKSGDTLQRIAASYLGSATCWQRIATLNGIRDPKTMRTGQLLKLP